MLAWLYQRMATDYMRATVSDPALRKILVPDYPIGGKRILISDDYYQCLERENVHVTTSEIDHLTEDSVVTKSGDEIAVDVVIFATGFESTEFLSPMEIQGMEARSLHEGWKEGAEAYLGITVSGFPNFLMMYGPNTNLGHNSIIFMIECQSRYIVGYIRSLFERNLRYLDLRREVMDSYNRQLQEELGRTAWAVTGRSWYKTEKGKITNNWSGTTLRYWWKTRKVKLGVYRSPSP
jgi:cation diffusion facilitator CzcD-associated flavoprotein CzcO